LIDDPLVNNPMLSSDSSGPKSLKGVPEGFWFSNADIGAAHDFFDQEIDPRDHRWI